MRIWKQEEVVLLPLEIEDLAVVIRTAQAVETKGWSIVLLPFLKKSEYT